MRIAILSDIHGNLPALEAVAADIDKQAPDHVWCGGDVAWGAPWASECIQFVRDAGWETVRGNTDVWITGDPQTIQETDKREELTHLADSHDINEDESQWLLNLPLGHTGPGSILLIHGTPESPFHAPQPDAPAGEFEMYEGKGSLVVYAHVHHAFARRLKDGTIVANTGAVGLPKDAPSSSYLLVDRNGPELTFTHRRVDFDIDSAVSSAQRIDGPVSELFVHSMRELG